MGINENKHPQHAFLSPGCFVLLQQFDGVCKSVSRLRAQVTEGQEEAKQAVAQQQQQQQLLEHQQLVLLEHMTELSSQLEGLSPASDALEAGRSPGGAREAGGGDDNNSGEMLPNAEGDASAAQFARRIDKAVEEKRYDDAFGMAISADLQKETRGYWVTYLCGTIDPGHLFDIDPPPLGQAALLGVAKGKQSASNLTCSVSRLPAFSFGSSASLRLTLCVFFCVSGIRPSCTKSFMHHACMV